MNPRGKRFVLSHSSPLGDRVTTVIWWDAEGLRHEDILVETINTQPVPLRSERQRNWPSKENPR